MPVNHSEARLAYRAAYRLARLAGGFAKQHPSVIGAHSDLYVKIFGDRSLYFQGTAQCSYEDRVK